MQLHEKHRPRELAAVVGQAPAVKVLTGLRERSGYGGRSFWITGGSGTGKTTLARIIAEAVSDPFNVEEADATPLRLPAVLDMERLAHLYGMGERNGRAFIVNEAHGLTAAVVRQFLTFLERLPGHVVIIFTTTHTGEGLLFEGCDDAGPLVSRCIKLALRRTGLRKPFAARCQQIAEAAGLNGKPLADYERLLKEHKNNLRAALQAVEAGAMLA